MRVAVGVRVIVTVRVTVIVAVLGGVGVMSCRVPVACSGRRRGRRLGRAGAGFGRRRARRAGVRARAGRRHGHGRRQAGRRSGRRRRCPRWAADCRSGRRRSPFCMISPCVVSSGASGVDEHLAGVEQRRRQNGSAPSCLKTFALMVEQARVEAHEGRAETRSVRTGVRPCSRGSPFEHDGLQERVEGDAVLRPDDRPDRRDRG